MKKKTRQRRKCADDTRAWFIRCDCKYCIGKKRDQLENERLNKGKYREAQ